jgi:hypothetical protein
VAIILMVLLAYFLGRSRSRKRHTYVEIRRL